MFAMKKPSKKKFRILEHFTGWSLSRQCLSCLVSQLQWVWCITYLHLNMQSSTTRNFVFCRWFVGSSPYFCTPLCSSSSCWVSRRAIWNTRLVHSMFPYHDIGQIAWSMLTIVIVVFQIRAVVPMIMDGLIWFVLSTTTVITNDTMAYFCGMLFGKKSLLSIHLTHRFIHKPLTPLSPNKSWEGFIGGGICTVIIGQIIVRSIQIPHLYCSFNHPNCPLPDYYQPQFYAFPEAVSNIIHLQGFSTCPIYLHELVFSVFASIVAPFGGFFASAIKRAYGKKDFNSIIPGHGGLMDRFDCQFIMLYFTSMYYATFIKWERRKAFNRRAKEYEVADVLRIIATLSLSDKQTIFQQLKESIALGEILSVCCHSFLYPPMMNVCNVVL